MSRKRTRDNLSEYSRIARDPDRPSGLMWWLPVVGAAVLSIPLHILGVRFSLMAAGYLRVLTQIAVDNATLIGMWCFAAAGWLSLAATLVSLWIAVTRSRVRSRWIWSGIGLAFAALIPLSFVFFLSTGNSGA